MGALSTKVARKSGHEGKALAGHRALMCSTPFVCFRSRFTDARTKGPSICIAQKVARTARVSTFALVVRVVGQTARVSNFAQGGVSPFGLRSHGFRKHFAEVVARTVRVSNFAQVVGHRLSVRWLASEALSRRSQVRRLA